MKQKIFAKLFFVAAFLIPSLVSAADDPFCEGSLEMLKAVEGSWTFKQEAGYGVGGVLPFPLPPHPPQSVTIEVEPETGEAYLKHAGQQMAMVPVPSEFAQRMDFYLTPEEETEILGTSTGCDWAAIPLIVGSNVYALENGPDVSRLYQMKVGMTTIYVCSNGEAGASMRRSEPVYAYSDENGNSAFMGPTGEIVDFEQKGFSQEAKDNIRNRAIGNVEKRCGKKSVVNLPSVPPGAMSVMLLVKFDTPNSGAGVLQFNGKMGPSSFAARAPVHLSR